VHDVGFSLHYYIEMRCQQNTKLKMAYLCKLHV